MHHNADMDINNFLEKYSLIQNEILGYFDNENDNFDDFKNFFDEMKIHENEVDIKKIFPILRTIIDNHYRKSHFFAKLEKIIRYFKEDAKQAFTNDELLDLFSQNKMALLILIKQKMIEINDSVIDTLKNETNLDYFMPEILSFYSDHPLTFDYNEYNEKREYGLNNDYLASLIRNDSVEKFISYVNRNNISLKSQIVKCDFETNPILINTKNQKEPTLIEYATFYGSIQIFRFLLINNVELTSSLWIYAIHSNNADLIHLLEENQIEPDDKTYEKCLEESIKCHHNDIANYFLNTRDLKNIDFNICLKYNNYDIIPKDKDYYSNYHISLMNLYKSIDINPDFYDLLFKASYLDINLKEKEKTILIIAIKEKNVKMIKFLLANPKTDLNIIFGNRKKEYTALSLAIEQKNIEIIRLLLSNQNINPNCILTMEYNLESTPLSMAIEQKNIEIIRLLLSNQNINPNCILTMEYNLELTPLSMAIEKNNIEIIQLLLSSQNVDPNIKLKRKINIYTALSIAIEQNNIKIINILLSNQNVNPNIIFEKDFNKTTALLMVIEQKKKDIIQLLVLF
ncbi:hypothetical protein M9Y10_029471 [Tritrichomonas musculus]|uniref:DUF3447 domain-containing protein n=1 Tax=Tritrichomonas musculus TaxID=1915356 RepID=A0ABR2KN53_9EUKA